MLLAVSKIILKIWLAINNGRRCGAYYLKFGSQASILFLSKQKKLLQLIILTMIAIIRTVDCYKEKLFIWLFMKRKLIISV